MRESIQGIPPEAARGDLGMKKYRLIGELGRGGMADVYLAVAAGPGGFNKLLVIKQLRGMENPQFLAMFLDEARLAARLSHPNVVQTFEVVHELNRAFIVMEFLDGPSLSRLRRSSRATGSALPLALELHVLSQALAGLQYAHDLVNYDGTPLRVVHRDFTPQNLIITFGGDVKIVDFGVAKALDSQSHTTVGMFKGKLGYAPPEQLLGREIDRRTDLFAAGVILWEALTGQSPWQGMDTGVLMQAVVNGDIPRLSSDPRIDPVLAKICERAMAPDPSARFASALEMREALERYIRSKGLETTRQRLGEYSSVLLADERAKMHAIIDKQIRQMQCLPTAEALVLAPLDALTPSPLSVVAGQNMPQFAAPAIQSSSPSSARAAPALAAQAEGPVSVSAPMSVPAPVFAPPKLDRTLKVVLGGIGALVVSLAAAVSLLWLRSGTTPKAAPEPARAAEASARLAEPPAPIPVPTAKPEAEAAAPVIAQGAPVAGASVAVRIRVYPPHARVYLDGVELPSNPFNSVLPRDVKLHELRIGAGGYLGLSRGIQLNRDISIDLTLERQKDKPAPKPAKAEPAPVIAAPAPARPPPAASESSSEDADLFTRPRKGAPSDKPKRQLDSDIRWNE